MTKRDNAAYRIKARVEERRGSLPSHQPSSPSAVPIDPAPESPWPAPMAAEAFVGPLGVYVRGVEPFTEADSGAIMLQLLVLFGSAVGRGPYFSVGNAKHHTNLYSVIVGATAGGKKGTSWSDARAAFRDVDSIWEARILGGLSSGEGLMYAVRDADPANEDSGAQDKRLFAHEPEFARVLAQSARQGNILSAVLRQGWDDGDLRNLTRSNPIRATGAHVSLVGHITPEELLSALTATDTANGFGNRFLWLLARRSKILPDPKPPPAKLMTSTRQALSDALEFGRQQEELFRTSEANAMWRMLYAKLDFDRPGMVGKLTSRAPVQVLRMAMIYALTMRESEIGRQHLEAASAVWDYCQRSVEYLFGGRDGDANKTELLQLIQTTPTGIARDEIRNYFQRHLSAPKLTEMLHDLARCKKIRGESQPTGGRPREVWYPIPEIQTTRPLRTDS